MSATDQDETRRLSRPARKRAKIVHEPAFSDVALSSEPSVAGDDSESDFDAPKKVKGTRNIAKSKVNAGTKGAEIGAKKSAHSKVVASVATKSPPPIKPQAAPFTQLPYDMIWEILAYYPTIPNWEVARNQAVLNSKYLQRYQVLRALSQTCRALRFQCHPHLWEHVQACLLKESGRHASFYRQVGEALQKQSHILASALPELQPLVRTMTVSLTRYQFTKILPAFVNALEMLPHLHTLRICHVHSQMTTHLKGAFEGHIFPQIKTIVLPSAAHNILRSCPNIKDVTNIEENGSKLAGAICQECPQVERLAGFWVTEFTLKRLAKALPKLRAFGLMSVGNTMQIEALSIFPELSTVEWGYPRFRYVQLQQSDDRREEKIKAAIAVLRKSKFQGDKRIVIHHPCHAAMPHMVPTPVPGVAPAQPKEEDGYEEVFRLPQEVKPSTI